MVGGALAFGFHQDGQFHIVVAIPRGERLEQLQSIAGGRHAHHYARAIGWWGSKRVFAGFVAIGGQHFAHGGCQAHQRAIGGRQRVGGGVEIQPASQGECEHRVGARHKRQRVGRAVVAFGEVAVKRVHDGVWLVGDRRGAIPLADARAARIGQHRGANGFEVGQDAVAFDRGANLLRPRRNQQLGFGAQTRSCCLAGE